MKNVDYCVTMHSKYEVMDIVISHNFFKTRYFAWIDVGLFRGLSLPPQSTDGSRVLNVFHLIPPADFDIQRVAYDAPYEFVERSPKEILERGLDWIAGGFFLGEWSVLSRWLRQYWLYLEVLLALRHTRTDQQILYAMLSAEGRGWFPSRTPLRGNNGSAGPLESQRAEWVDVQAYKNNRGKQFNDWFYLGYLCKETWEKQEFS